MFVTSSFLTMDIVYPCSFRLQQFLLLMFYTFQCRGLGDIFKDLFLEIHILKCGYELYHFKFGFVFRDFAKFTLILRVFP